MWRRKREASKPPRRHHGRIWKERDSGMWRYVCQHCDYGAGTMAAYKAVAGPWLTRLANDHADPGHWSRRRREYERPRCCPAEWPDWDEPNTD